MSAAYDPITAYHEAGHAVVALVLGRPVDRVSVLPKEERLGQCEFRKSNYRPSDDWLECEILISLAGMAAEARFTGNYSWSAAGQDLRYVRTLSLERAGERRVERYERRMLAKVENLLAKDEHWQAVERIAAELLRVGAISGRAVRHLFEQ